MIFDLSTKEFNEKFESLMREPFMQLPRRWDGKDFSTTLRNEIYKNYLDYLKPMLSKGLFIELNEICDKVISVIDHYHNGKPSTAFSTFNNYVMKILEKHMFKAYRKEGNEAQSRVILFRTRGVFENREYTRKEIFHIPYNARAKVGTCRYSIAGYPCLYLGNSLDLCLMELYSGTSEGLTIASRFQFNRDFIGKKITVIELAIKPKHFFMSPKERSERIIYGNDLTDKIFRVKYLFWFPIIAACSFIRVCKTNPFASEYIVPQLLLQWIRKENEKDHLFGIRYFSCASERASEIGINYVFPVSGFRYESDKEYCAILANAFKLSKPVFLHEYDSIEACKDYLIKDTNIEFI